MFSRRVLPLGAALVLALSQTAIAAEFTVNQKGKKFSEKKITAKVGDTIKFVNDDSNTHNVFSRDSGFKFNSGVQKPGSVKTMELDKAGKFTARCAMHPKMKVKVTVK